MKWEYKRHRFDDAVNMDDLNEFGKDGWEIITIMTMPYGSRFLYDVYMKREIPEKGLDILNLIAG